MLESINAKVAVDNLTEEEILSLIAKYNVLSDVTYLTEFIIEALDVEDTGNYYEDFTAPVYEKEELLQCIEDNMKEEGIQDCCTSMRDFRKMYIYELRDIVENELDIDTIEYCANPEPTVYLVTNNLAHILNRLDAKIVNFCNQNFWFKETNKPLLKEPVLKEVAIIIKRNFTQWDLR